MRRLARRIDWWHYSGCRMISFTPWYVILGEFGIALAFALLARTPRRGTWREAVIAGIGGGLSIFVCYALAFWITGLIARKEQMVMRCEPAGPGMFHLSLGNGLGWLFTISATEIE